MSLGDIPKSGAFLTNEIWESARGECISCWIGTKPWVDAWKLFDVE